MHIDLVFFNMIYLTVDSVDYKKDILVFCEHNQNILFYKLYIAIHNASITKLGITWYEQRKCYQ